MSQAKVVSYILGVSPCLAVICFFFFVRPEKEVFTSNRPEQITGHLIHVILLDVSLKGALNGLVL